MASSSSPLLFSGCPGSCFHNDDRLWGVLDERDNVQPDSFLFADFSVLLVSLFKLWCKDKTLQIRKTARKTMFAAGSQSVALCVCVCCLEVRITVTLTKQWQLLLKPAHTDRKHIVLIGCTDAQIFSTLGVPSGEKYQMSIFVLLTDIFALKKTLRHACVLCKLYINLPKIAVKYKYMCTAVKNCPWC